MWKCWPSCKAVPPVCFSSLRVISLSSGPSCNKGDVNETCKVEHDNKSQCRETVHLSPAVVPDQHFNSILFLYSFGRGWCMMCQQNRWAKTLTRDPNGRHVLSIWTLPAPQRLVFQFLSTAQLHHFPPNLLWKSMWLWSMLWSLFGFM